jgi:[CysO sulfur-carrier protein]-S-L-cysteine hydrolase
MLSRNLILTPAQRAQMVAHVDRHAPHEACGILAGQGDRVTQVYLVENVRHSPVAYEMDPVQQVEAMIALENAGWDLCGIFHSHPAGPPVPSATDLAEAYYPEAVYVILAPNGRGWGMRGFSLAGGGVQEVTVVVAE